MYKIYIIIIIVALSIGFIIFEINSDEYIRLSRVILNGDISNLSNPDLFNSNFDNNIYKFLYDDGIITDGIDTLYIDKEGKIINGKLKLYKFEGLFRDQLFYNKPEPVIIINFKDGKKHGEWNTISYKYDSTYYSSRMNLNGTWDYDIRYVGNFEYNLKTGFWIEGKYGGEYKDNQRTGVWEGDFGTLNFSNGKLEGEQILLNGSFSDSLNYFNMITKNSFYKLQKIEFTAKKGKVIGTVKGYDSYSKLVYSDYYLESGSRNDKWFKDFIKYDKFADIGSTGWIIARRNATNVVEYNLKLRIDKLKSNDKNKYFKDINTILFKSLKINGGNRIRGLPYVYESTDTHDKATLKIQNKWGKFWHGKNNDCLILDVYNHKFDPWVEKLIYDKTRNTFLTNFIDDSWYNLKY